MKRHKTVVMRRRRSTEPELPQFDSAWGDFLIVYRHLFKIRYVISFMGKSPPINAFFDINKFPQEEGLLVFGISMSRIGNAQSAAKCFEYVESLIPKIIKPAVGLILLYADGLYLNSDEVASSLKKKYQSLINSHKYEFVNLLKKHPWYIPRSISYLIWNQLLLESKEYFDYLGKLKEIYKKDKQFQSCLHQDIHKTNPTQNEINFILEETLVFYLMAKGKMRLQNEYVQDKEKWILGCYPSKPLKSEIYLFQNNFFKLSNPTNQYEMSYYDLEAKKLYDYARVDLASLS